MSTKPNICIHQIYYAESQLPRLDSAFIPYDNQDNPHPELREYYVFKQAYEKGLTTQADWVGFFSWKYYQKTGVSGKKFIRFIQDNPGYDAYFINPMQHVVKRFQNVWLQGEKCHPGIIDLTHKILHGIGYDVDVRDWYMNFESTSYCNFWVGTPAVWQTYMKLANKVYDYIMHELDEEDHALIFKRADHKIDASFFPFIMERLFSTLLFFQPEIKVCAYRYSIKDLIKRYAFLVYEKYYEARYKKRL